MDPLSKIVSLLEAIREKHGSPATFVVKNFGDHISYVTYIAMDISPTHIDHDDLHSAMLRLQTFLDVDDVAAYNRKIALEKLDRLREEKEDICSKIREYEEYI